MTKEKLLNRFLFDISKFLAIFGPFTKFLAFIKNSQLVRFRNFCAFSQSSVHFGSSSFYSKNFVHIEKFEDFIMKILILDLKNNAPSVFYIVIIQVQV